MHHVPGASFGRTYDARAFGPFGVGTSQGSRQSSRQLGDTFLRGPGKPLLQFEVTNESHWESATRVPATGQNAGFGDHLIPDARRDTGLGIGGDFRQKYVWTQPAP